LQSALGELNVEFGAGHLCLDFANTADWHASAQPIELIPSYMHLLAWAQLREALATETIQSLADLATHHPADALDALARAIALREAIYGVFSARHRERSANPANLALINEELQHAFDHLHLNGGLLAWEWQETQESLDAPLWPIVQSMADLLTSSDVGRVRECAGDPCGWLFLDTSRNRSRRWCSMESCGNRAKARRHYERTRSMPPRG